VFELSNSAFNFSLVGFCRTNSRRYAWRKLLRNTYLKAFASFRYRGNSTW
jgi:hypothetical protein